MAYKLVILAVAALCAAAPAAAAISVIGGGNGKACFEAAEYNRPTMSSIAACNQAIEDEAMSVIDRAATFVNRGIVHMQAKHLTAAIADYDAAIKLRPATAEAYVNKGIALLHLGGRDQEAVATLTEGLARNPHRPEVAYYSRGVAYEMIGSNREAYEDYAKAAELAPTWEDPAVQLQRFKVVRAKTGQG